MADNVTGCATEADHGQNQQILVHAGDWPTHVRTSLVSDCNHNLPPSTDPVGRLRMLAAAVAEARRRLAQGTPFQLAPLQTALETALSELHSSRRESATALLVLLDEVGGLSSELECERNQLRARMREWTYRRRAGSSYRPAGRPS